MNQKIWVLLMGVFLTAGTAASSPNPLEIYQRALVQEQAAGDLPEAMELYEQAAKEAGTDRGLAARALIRAAGCAEKLGQPAAATGLYTQVMHTFPEQREQIRDGVFERPIEHQDLAADLLTPRIAPNEARKLTTPATTCCACQAT